MRPTLEVSRKLVNNAGDILSGRIVIGMSRDEALKVLENFRSIHTHPLNVFRILLQRKSKTISGDVLISQRLKRTPSIINKLKIQKNMSLSQMQDVGGLRAVVNNLSDVYGLKDMIRSSEAQVAFKSTLVKEKDYIKEPKDSGYRSIHLVYKYEKNVASDRHCRIEIQLRTKNQHAWATAVEVIGTYLRQPLKQSFGDKKILDLFKEISKAFIFLEENKIDIPQFKKVISSVQDLKLRDLLRGFSLVTEESNQKTGKYFLITLNFQQKTVSLKRFTEPKLDQANAEYSELEKKYLNDKSVEVVLVSVDDMRNLQKLYPNYFLDTQEFLKLLDKLQEKLLNHEK